MQASQTIIGSITYGTSTVMYLLLSVVLMTGWRGRLRGSALLFAAVVACLWSASISYYFIDAWQDAHLLHAAEVVRTGAWIVFVASLFNSLQKDTRPSKRSINLIKMSALALAIVMVILPYAAGSIPAPVIPSDFVVSFTLIGFMLLAVTGMWLLEMLYRNASRNYRWGLKHLCLALGGMFAFDFYLYADAMMFNAIDWNLWYARGAVNAIVVPILAISVVRNPRLSEDIFVSREITYYAVTFLAAGGYLLVMAAAGYYINVKGGEWGAVVQAIFLFMALAILVALLYSGQVRAKIRVFLNKHFYDYKYDYRKQWLRFTAALSACRPDEQPRQCLVSAVCDILGVPGGALFYKDDKHRIRYDTHWNMPLRESDDESLAGILEFLRDKNWLISLDEYRVRPDKYANIELPDWLGRDERAWLIVPLIYGGALNGFLLLSRPLAKVDFDWELRDLVNTIASQSAAFLVQMDTVHALAEARQFEGFNRLSAFVLHDLKNIIAQQSLMITSATRHRGNPAFMDDLIGIMSHSVAKMQRLMELLRGGMQNTQRMPVNLLEVVTAAVKTRKVHDPAPSVALPGLDVLVMGHFDRLVSVLENVIQNAQEATDKHGHVKVSLHPADDRVEVVIEDDGVGMDQQFINTRLFKPFDTTKGDTGMGIGAYDSRAYLRELGGDLLVESQPGSGTTMRLVIPCEQIIEQQQDLVREHYAG